ncbi:hypothetical protein BLNAU_23338 [Blattamonas nauphoetae]|uniref:DDE-1 domain-containing protein n=1 Tax=Blattamonas nauphoetae TaxID=2049346 RepID=A0ABQ9WSP7_9EUKA|nr:hypothetical protein BLNAU_23338 [Blattamonas nauphoetae]
MPKVGIGKKRKLTEPWSRGIVRKNLERRKKIQQRLRQQIDLKKKAELEGRQPHQNGRPKILTEVEEEELVSILVNGRDGFPAPTDKDVGPLAHSIRQKHRPLTPDVREPPSPEWARLFRLRHSELRLIKPTFFDKYRLFQTTSDTILPFLGNVREKIKNEAYHPALILNLDETSCQIKGTSKSGRVVSSKTKFLPALQKMPLHHLTCLFIVQSNGWHIPSHMILPSYYKTETIEKYYNPNMHIHFSNKGWMTKELFHSIMMDSVLPCLTDLRAKLTQNDQARILILLDGHGSRLNLDLWGEFYKNRVDVVCIPAHTSHVVQPLDRAPNAVFKRRLRGAPPAPGLRTLATDLQPFLDGITDCVEEALLPSVIRAGFRNAGVTSGDLDHLNWLPTQAEVVEKNGITYNQPSFSLSGKTLTCPFFRDEWTTMNQKRQRTKKKDEKKTDKPRVEIDFDDDEVSDVVVTIYTRRSTDGVIELSDSDEESDHYHLRASHQMRQPSQITKDFVGDVADILGLDLSDDESESISEFMEVE